MIDIELARTACLGILTCLGAVWVFLKVHQWMARGASFDEDDEDC